MSASSKEEFEKVKQRFLISEITDKPMIFEVFTDVADEDMALRQIYNIEVDTKHKVIKEAKNILGSKNVEIIKKLLG